MSNLNTKPTSIIVNGRRWFDRVNGNTYFSAIGYVDGDIGASIDFEYGYGDHYLDRIGDELEKAGFLPNIEHYSNGSKQSLWDYCRKNDIKLQYSAADVSRKRDL